MVCAKFYYYFLIAILVVGYGSECNAQFDMKALLGDKPLTPRKIVEDVLKYFQQDDPRGIPVIKLPKTIKVEGPIETTQLTLRNISITGHSNISLEYVDINLQKLQIQVRLNIPHLEVLGDYFWPSFWSNSEGEMNLTLLDLDVGAICDLGVTNEGLLEVLDLKAIINPDTFLPDFTGLSGLHSGLVFAADTLFSTVIVPIIQGRVKDKGITRINDRLKARFENKPFPIDMSPVDYLIAKVRSDIVRERNLDPFLLKEVEKSYMGISVVLKNIELRGLSTLHRSDIIRTEFVDNRIYVTIELGTQRLEGSADWTVYTSLLPIGSGHFEIFIDSLRVSVEAQQDADVRHPPIMRRIDIELGNIALRSKGERNFDYFLEAAVNIVPNIFRNVIMDKRVEGRVKTIIQERFNKINLQHIIFERLDKMEKEKNA